MITYLCSILQGGIEMNKSLLKYIAALLLFGSNGIVAGMIALNSYEIVMFRTLIGSVFLIVLYLITNRTFTFYRHLRSFAFLVFSGISMGVSWLFLYEAYKQIGVSIASLGYYCGPVIVMALSPLIFKERLTKQKLIGFVAVLAGILFVNANAVNEKHTGFGVFCALMSAVMYSCMVLFNKKAEDIKGFENSTLQLFIAFISVLIFTLFKQGLSFHIPAQDIATLVFLGLVNTGLGCYLYFSSIGKIKVQTVAVLGYLEPLSAIIFSVIFLKEKMSVLQITGALLIIAGAVFAEIKRKQTVNTVEE